MAQSNPSSAPFADALQRTPSASLQRVLEDEPLGLVPADTRITPTVTPEGAVAAETARKPWPWWAEIFRPAFIALGTVIPPVRYSTIVTLFILSVAGIGVCHGVEQYFGDINWRFSASHSEFKCTGLIAPFRGVCLLSIGLLSLKLLFVHAMKSGSPIHWLDTLLVPVVLLAVGICVWVVAVEAGGRVGAYLPVRYQPAPIQIGRTVGAP